MKEEPALDPSILAEQDQDVADARHQAQCVIRFWRELVDAGLDHDLLGELTTMFFGSMSSIAVYTYQVVPEDEDEDEQ